MSPTVLVYGKVFDGVSEELPGSAEILIEGDRIASDQALARSAGDRSL
jgi:hypothetical protein